LTIGEQESVLKVLTHWMRVYEVMYIMETGLSTKQNPYQGHYKS